MKGFRLSFIRHGKTEANLEGKYIGVTDLPLCQEGKDELIRKYDNLTYPKVQKVYTSPLTRCVETAEIVFPDRFLHLVPDLCEIDFGEFEGKSAEELIGREDYKKWLKGGLDNPAPRGESLREVTMRCYGAMQGMILDMMNEGFTHCGVVTHSGIIMNIMAGFGLPKLKPYEFTSDFGEGYEIIVSANLWQSGNVFEILGKIPYNSTQADDGFGYYISDME